MEKYHTFFSARYVAVAASCLALCTPMLASAQPVEENIGLYGGQVADIDAFSDVGDFTVALTITTGGTGTGTVIPYGIGKPGLHCGDTCTELYPAGTVVALTARPDPGSEFTAWSGDSDCEDGRVSMASARTCVAQFATLSSDFTDPDLTVIKMVHVSELRTRINAVRTSCGLSVATFTDDPLTTSTLAKAIHVTELRTALAGAYAASPCSIASPIYTDSSIDAGVTVIKAAHITELRSAVVALEAVANVPFDLATVNWLHTNVTSWAQNSTLTNMTISSTAICLYHTRAGQWPQISVSNTAVEGNPWVFAKIGGQWYGGTYEWLRPGQQCKGITASNIGPHIKVAPMASWQPQSGETVWFMVSTPARLGPQGSLRERTNVVRATWP